MSSLLQIIDVETVSGDAVPVKIPFPNRAAALEVNDAVTVAVEGANVADAYTKVPSECKNVGIGEGSENIAILHEGGAGGGGGGGGGVFHFSFLFSFRFRPYLLRTVLL